MGRSVVGMDNRSEVRDFLTQLDGFVGGLDKQKAQITDALDGLDRLTSRLAAQKQVLDVALAYSVINRHFDTADFLLEHGADINTNWNSHEPASILHHLVFLPDSYESMQYLIDRGIDMTIKDYRWGSNAVGWARYGKSDEQMAQWLEEAERRRGAGRGGR